MVVVLMVVVVVFNSNLIHAHPTVGHKAGMLSTSCPAATTANKHPGNHALAKTLPEANAALRMLPEANTALPLLPEVNAVDCPGMAIALSIDDARHQVLPHNGHPRTTIPHCCTHLSIHVAVSQTMRHIWHCAWRCQGPAACKL